MSEEKEKIIFKIKKLLTMADGKANLNEALAAAEIAQRLILLHNIAEADLNVAENCRAFSKEEVIDWVVANKRPFTPIINPAKHLQYLLKVIADANTCQVYVFDTQNESGHIVSAFSIVGTKTNIELIEYMFCWLMIQGSKLFSESKANNIEDFFFGLATKLKQRFEKVKEEIQKENALVLRKHKNTNEIEKYMDSISSSLKENGEIIEPKDASSFMEGMRAGEKLILDSNKQIDNSKIKQIGEIE